jgi:hypothetical protein
VCLRVCIAFALQVFSTLLFLGKIIYVILMQEREVKAKHQQLISGVSFIFGQTKNWLLVFVSPVLLWNLFYINISLHRFLYFRIGRLRIYGTSSASYFLHLLQ